MLKIECLKAFYGRNQIIHGIDLDVSGGQVTGLIGRNGVGKTTTVKGIMNLVSSSGQIYLETDNISSFKPEQISRQGVGYVPQGRMLFSQLTVLDNLKIGWHGGAFSKKQLEPVLERFSPLRKLLARRAGTLSGGEQQMVAIGRILTNNPKVILCDEPTEGLSPLYVENVKEVILDAKRNGKAILLIDQNLKFVLSTCDWIVFMNNGQLVYSCGSAEANDPDVLERFLAVRGS